MPENLTTWSLALRDLRTLSHIVSCMTSFPYCLWQINIQDIWTHKRSLKHFLLVLEIGQKTQKYLEWGKYIETLKS